MHLINFAVFVVPKFAKVWDIYFIRKCCEIKPTVTFGPSLNRKETLYLFSQVDSIFGLKGIILPKTLKLPRNSTVLDFLGASDKTIKFLSCLILIRVLQNVSKEFHSIYGSVNTASSRFHAVSFVCK